MKSIYRALFCGTSALALCSFSSVALAQDAPAAEDDGIVVTGLRGALRDALVVKRSSALVMEAISSEDIGQLPDVTVAESLVRLPGLNGARDRGNASQATVRGLGPRLVLGLINGREMASSDADRSVRWDIYPSEVVSGAQVYKSQSANLVSGGVAGTINIETVDPLDYTGNAFNGRWGPVLYTGSEDFPDYDPLGYRASGSYVAHLSDTFAVAIGLSYQDQNNGYESFEGWGYNDERLGGSPGDLNGDGTLDHTPWGAKSEVKMLDQDRTGIMTAAQWRVTPDFELSFDALWSESAISERQNQTWYGDGTWGNWANGNAGAYNAPGSSYTIEDGDVVAATLANSFSRVQNVIAVYNEDRTLFATGLNGTYTAGNLTFNGDLSYSTAERLNTWQAVHLPTFPASTSFDMRDGILPFVTTSSNTADVNTQFFPDWMPVAQHDGPETVEDTLMAGAFNVEYATDGEFFESFEAGARVSNRVKGHTFIGWNESTAPGGVAVPANLLRNYQLNQFTVPIMLDGNFYDLVNLAVGGFQQPAGITTQNQYLSNRWEVTEDVSEAYVMGNISHGDWSGNVGVRLVDVSSESWGYQDIGSGLVPVTIENSYTEVLPSISLNYELTEDTVLRFGAAQVLSRPPLDELRASRTLESPLPPVGTGTAPLGGSGGNPNLEPFRATQIDLSYEWYFADEALLAASFFFKDVESNIGVFINNQDIDPDGAGPAPTATYVMNSPANGDGGNITGVEITFQTPFSFIPALENFGIYSNFSFVNSDIKEFYPAYAPLDGSGYAPFSSTVDLWYSNGGFEMRFGHKYHDAYTLAGGFAGANINTLDAESIFDFSTSYQITDNVGLRFQVGNITDEPSRTYREGDPDRLGTYSFYGRRILFDISYTF